MAAEDAGTISAQIRLELNQLERDSLQAQKMMNHYAQEFKKEGEKGGKEYVKGFGKGQLELNKKLNEMVSSFRGVSPAMGNFGDKLAQVFSKPIFSMIPVLSTAFQAMLPVIGSVIAAVAAIAAGVKKGLNAWKEQSKHIEASGEATKRLNGTYKEAEKNLSSQVKIGDKLRVVFQPLADIIEKIGAKIAAAGKFIFEWLTPIGVILANIEKIQAGFATINAIISGDKRKLSEIYEEQLKIVKAKAEDVAEARILAEQVDATNAAEDQYKQTLDEIATAKNVFNKNEKEVAAEQLSALESLTSELIKQREIAVDMAGVDADLVKNIDKRLQELKTEKELLEEITKEIQKAEKTDAERIDEARQAAIEKYTQAVKAASDAKAAGLIGEEEMQNRLNAALAAEYADLEAIATQYREVSGAAKAQIDRVIELRNKTAETVKVNQDVAKAMEYQLAIDDVMIQQGDTLKQQDIDRAYALANAAETEEQQNSLIEKAIALENQLITAQRNRVKDALQNEEWFREASTQTQETILNNFDAITEGMLKTKEDIEKIAKKMKENDDGDKKKGLWAELFGDDADAILEIGNRTVEAFQSAAQMITEITRINAQEAMNEIDRVLKETRKKLKEDRDQALEAEGFIEAQTAEQWDRRIELAKESGDQILQYNLERRRREWEINKEYDDADEAAQEEANQKKAQLDYDAAMLKYKMDIAQGIITGAQTIMGAIAAGWAPPFGNPVLAAAYGGLAGAAVGAQMAVLVNNPPKMPQYETGGIVPGNSWSGDHIMARVNSGELILNRAQQDTIAGQLGGAQGVMRLEVPVYLDRVVMARAMAEVYGSGAVLIPKRGIDPR